MTNINFTIVCLIVIIFFILGVFIGKFNQEKEKIDNFILDGKVIETIKNRSTLPYGYTMETNGEEFAYITETGHKNIFPSNSLEKEIKTAWKYYEYKNKKDKDIWIPFEISKDKN